MAFGEFILDLLTRPIGKWVDAENAVFIDLEIGHIIALIGLVALAAGDERVQTHFAHGALQRLNLAHPAAAVGCGAPQCAAGVDVFDDVWIRF